LLSAETERNFGLPELQVVVILVGVIFMARWLESIMGFGGTVLALPALAILTPGLHVTETLVPVLALGNIVCCIGIVWVGHKDLVWKEYGIILLWAVIGLPLGFWLAGYAPESILRLILGGFVLVVAVANIAQMWKPDTEIEIPQGALTRFLLRLALVIGGIVHGMFTTGGPLLVIYATKALRTKGLFRVTLGLVWLTLNTIMVAGWMLDGRIAAHVWTLTGITVPFIIMAVIVGDHFHHRIPEVLFRKAAYVLLLLAGVSLIWKSLPQVLQA
jgi:uncharacterized protein